ncbi:MAG: hypothetical protein MHM6MM_008878 [Cercozoa sp. M6MM]
MMWRLLGMCCLLSLALAQEEPVTIGSAFRLQHENTGHRLHSQAINLQGGSGQQLVTGVKEGNLAESLWRLQSAHGQKQLPFGSAVPCDSVVRLTHVSTRR